MRPLGPAVLVAVELPGAAAKVAGEGLRGRHGEGLRGRHGEGASGRGDGWKGRG